MSSPGRWISVAVTSYKNKYGERENRIFSTATEGIDMRFLYILALCMPLLGCDSTEENIINAAKLDVMSKLNDPDAAKFSDLIVHQTESGVANKTSDTNQKVRYQSFSVCGSVNGKNLFGAYTGKTRFVSFVVKVETQENPSVINSVYDEGVFKKTGKTPGHSNEPESIFEAVYWNKVCVDAQHPKTYTGTN
ncbi:hypothetical protein [Klebsiella oxytoca]|uniref:hypothetical protein n=1 Tax=Klebsiella oxytoca TaxID=571 RepID=UPI0011E6D7DE|nr:hypothetical protein [Klebsiella oxytoca]